MTRVAVLYGGTSSERDVSLNTGAAVVAGLKEAGYEVDEIDLGNDALSQLAALKCDVIFNALHGGAGEDGTIPAVLEILGIPYTHSGVRASAIAMHKPMAKKLFSAGAIPVAPGKIVQRSNLVDEDGNWVDPIPRPYVIKPVADGSSVGVIIVQEGDTLRLADMPNESELLIEQFVQGRELTVAVLDGEPMGVLEIKPKDGFYDYQNKYTKGRTDYIVPADIPKLTYNDAMEYAARAHIMLGCRGVTRSDFMLDDDGQLVMLELNTHPGMTATSLVPKIAAANEMSFSELCSHLVESATLDHAG